MKILAIDTSTMFGSVALCEDDNLIAEIELGVELTHSEKLITTIDNLLKNSKCVMDSTQGIAVAIGPGSFTGLRIGLATAKGIALGLGKPIAGVSSLLVLAHNGVLSDATVVSIIDARRGEVYAAAYRFENKKLKCVMEEMFIDPKLLCKKLENNREKLFLVGDGVVTYEKIFREELGEAIIKPQEFKFPHASHLARLAAGKLKNGGDDITKLVPNYLRHSDAEIGLRDKKQTKEPL